jgi:hypothetical protein
VMERLRRRGSSGRSPRGRRALRRARTRVLRVLATLAAVSAISAALVVMFVPSALDVVTSAQETDPETPSADPSPSATPSPSVTAAPTLPPVPLPSAAPPIVQYPTVARLDRAMSRRGMTRVPRGSWKGARFSVASFNVLGASHTRGPGRRKGYAGAEARLPAQLDMLAAKNISVAGLQEFQYPQVSQLRNRTGDAWGIWPGTQLGNWLADNSIIWRTDQWTAVETTTVDVPYFGGRMTAMPYVLLEHLESERRVWFANFHNPANVAGDARGHRARAVQIEAALVKELSADGTPVIVTGDMNDRAEFACPFASASGMYSPNGAEARESGCALPAKMDVDWIFGTRDLEFSGYQSDASARDRKLSDHPLITADAFAPGVEDRRDCRAKISRRGVAWYCPTA